MQGRYVVGQHAAERLDERGILEWQLVEGMEHATLLAEFPGATPNPAIEAWEALADGVEVKVVWSHLVGADVAKLVTVHFYEG